MQLRMLEPTDSVVLRETAPAAILPSMTVAVISDDYDDVISAEISRHMLTTTPAWLKDIDVDIICRKFRTGDQ